MFKILGPKRTYYFDNIVTPSECICATDKSKRTFNSIEDWSKLKKVTWLLGLSILAKKIL